MTPASNVHAPGGLHGVPRIYYYSVFGERLSSTLEFRDLNPVEEGPVRWAFRVVNSLPDMINPVQLGEEAIYADVSARLIRHSRGHRIEVCDTGSFEIGGGGIIRWRPLDDPWWDFGRGHLLGRVLATALHLDGIHTLHGSAVELGGGVVGFLAPKFTGKSTLALHLCRAGAALVTDDSIPVEVTPEVVLAHPGVHVIRLATMNEAAAVLESTGRDGKFRLANFPMGRRMQAPRPLVTLYLLRSVTMNPAGEAVRRVSIPGPLQVMRVLAHAKVGEMLGASAGAALFANAATLAERVRVQELHVVRDRERLPEVVQQLLGWHGSGIALPREGEVVL